MTTEEMSRWYSNLEKDPLHPALCNENRSFSRADAEDLSGKLYAAFLEMGIGKEDVVLIALPRSAKMFIAAMAVLKVGAAYILFEISASAQRLEYIKEDSRCRLVLTEDVFDKLTETSMYRKGYANADEHDAACIIYTSGTTGHPKGIIHERGNILFSHHSLFCSGQSLQTADSRVGVLCPLNFAAAELMLNAFLNVGIVLYIINYDTIKNSDSLLAFLGKVHINQLFMTPDYFRMLEECLPESVKTVFIGGASAHRISGTGRIVYNTYMSSETGFAVCKYRVGELLQTVPVGKPEPPVEMKLDEDGEILCTVPYTRGYLHRELNQGVFCGGWYHTGDIGRIDENGDLIILGRKDEMIKINGSRVEPEEVASVFSSLSGLPCAVRGFYEGERQYLALYYASDREIETDEIIHRMRGHLPYYMIPSCFVRLDQLPVLESGKVSVRELPVPAEKETPYTAPETELEKKFCHAVEEELGREHVGVEDDFFVLGGDSLKIIRIISKMNTDGLRTDHFYKGRTVKRILELYQNDKNELHLSLYQKEMDSRRWAHPLSDQQLWFYKISLFPGVYTLNIAYAVSLGKEIEPEKLCAVLNAYTSASSTFQTVIVEDQDGTPYFRYAPELYRPVRVEQMSESEAEQLCETFVQQHTLRGGLLYRIRLIQTEKRSILFFDFHHTVTDGYGVRLFLTDILDAYFGKPLAENHFFAWAYERECTSASRETKMIAEQIRNRAVGYEWSLLPVNGQKEEYFRFYDDTVPTGICLKDLEAFLHREKISRSAFFAAAFVLSAAKVCGKQDIFFLSVCDNRSGVSNHGGFRATSNGVYVHFEKGMSLDALFDAVKKELETAKAANVDLLLPNEKTFRDGFRLNDIGDLLQPDEVSEFVTPVKLNIPASASSLKASPLSFRIIYFVNANGFLFVNSKLYVKESLYPEHRKLILSLSDTLKRLLERDSSLFEL